jgi:hypothetical protein
MVVQRDERLVELMRLRKTKTMVCTRSIVPVSNYETQDVRCLTHGCKGADFGIRGEGRCEERYVAADLTLIPARFQAR